MTSSTLSSAANASGYGVFAEPSPDPAANSETPKSHNSEEAGPKIAIVIDDLGYSAQKGHLFAHLPYPITMAIIPSSPHANHIAKLAIEQGQELILHVPMEPKDISNWEDGLSTSQDRPEFLSRLNQMLDHYPTVKGINNHGGSRLTTDQERMTWVMETLAGRKLFFLDSRTTSESVAILAAEEQKVRHLSRDVFLDHEQSVEKIDAAFDRVRAIARRHGHAIAIGHPHEITIERLIDQIPRLIDEGFELIYCSDLLSSNKTIEVEHQPNGLSSNTYPLQTAIKNTNEAL